MVSIEGGGISVMEQSSIAVGPVNASCANFVGRGDSAGAIWSSEKNSKLFSILMIAADSHISWNKNDPSALETNF